MPEATATPASIQDFLAEPLTVGDPIAAGPLTVFPLFGPEPTLSYVSFAQAHEGGVAIRELTSGASVNDLLVENPSGDDVLLFDGEEILGAQQNRTFDLTVLVAAASTLKVPVSCVEAGRWDGSRHSEPFRPSPQAAYPKMRRMKAEQVRASAFAGREARASQSEVWREADEVASRYQAHSPTAAVHEVYESRRGHLNEICAAIEPQPNQVGSIAAYGEGMQVLDYVSRPVVYASLHTRLVQGYALDALDAPSDLAFEPETASGFSLLACDAPIAQRTNGVGLGEDVRFQANGVAGAGLTHEEELVQLTVFPDRRNLAQPERRPDGSRIRRPSRRRLG